MRKVSQLCYRFVTFNIIYKKLIDLFLVSLYRYLAEVVMRIHKFLVIVGRLYLITLHQVCINILFRLAYLLIFHMLWNMLVVLCYFEK